MPSSETAPVPPPIGTTVHIYRGLMDRATTWRNRIDAPTNWAIISSGTAVSFVLSDPVRSHVVLLLMMFMMFAFLTIEARRMRYYDLWSSWVRLLETEYFAPIISNNQVTIDALWEQMMVRDMDFPHFKSDFKQMLIRRLRDNYLAILLFLLMAWLLKLLFHERTDLPPRLADNFVPRATIGPIPGWLVLTVVLTGYIMLFVVVLVASRESGQSVEVLSSERILQRLASPLQQPVNPNPWHIRLVNLYAQTHDNDEIEHIE